MTLLPILTRSAQMADFDSGVRTGVVADMDASEVYRVYGASVLGYLRGQRVDDPEDLLGEVFFQVTRSLPTFEGSDDDLRRWVFTIARNRVIDARRRRARRPRTVALGTHDEVVDGPADPHEELLAAIGALTEEQREVVALRFIADLSLEDVARLTGRTLGATKSMQHRALDQLARRLEATEEAP